MIYTFYSYKGGVGRTMALANIAELFYRSGLSVLMVDWDLEAPGLERYFPTLDHQKTLCEPGIIELLAAYRAEFELDVDDDSPLIPQSPQDFIIDVDPNGDGKGKLQLLTAGCRSPENFSHYASAVQSFNWTEFYEEWEGERYFNWLRDEFNDIADVVLIDSRTGVTEMGGVCTYHLADMIVMLCAPNEQNLEGTFNMFQNFTAPEVRQLRGDRVLNVLTIPSRLERAERSLLDNFQKRFDRVIGTLQRKNPNLKFSSIWDLGIPYIPGYAFGEEVVVRPPVTISAQDLSEAYGAIADTMARVGTIEYALPKVITAEVDFASKLEITHGDFVGSDKVRGDMDAGDKIVYQSVADESFPAPGNPPYKGLNYFDVADSNLFFGREELINDLVNHVRSHNFLAVIGSSGSGKSSLVRAGLVPRLQDGAIKGSEHWPIHILTPTSHPIENLANSLTQDSESVTAAVSLADDIRKDERSLSLFISRQIKAKRVDNFVLIIDQFEEIFTLTKDNQEQRQFVNSLIIAARSESATVVLTLRADFYANCADYHGLRSALENHQKLVGAMTSDELRSAIVEPARRGNWELESGLVELLIDEVEDEPSALPLLSHALLTTWQRRSSRTLTLSGYIDSGGVQGAIASSAEEIFHSLDTQQQKIARRIFISLTELGEGFQDTRRRIELNELMGIERHDEEVINQVLNRLVNTRLLVTNDHSIEVAHETLIREWPRMRDWINEDREKIRLHRRLSNAAQEWSKFEQSSDLLYRGSQLQQTSELIVDSDIVLNSFEQAFVNESIKHAQATERRERRRSRLIKSLVITTIFLLAIPASSSLINLWISYQQQNSVWQTVGFPASNVFDIAEAPNLEDADTPRICIGTFDLGIGCSQDLNAWSIYQSGLPFTNNSNSSSFTSSFIFGLRSNGPAQITAVAFDQANPMNIFAVVRDHGIYASTDRGVFWTPLPNIDLLSTVAGQKLIVIGPKMYFLNGSSRFVSQEQRGVLYTSEDGGESWKAVSGMKSAIGMINDFDVSNGDSETQSIYAASGSTIYLSENNQPWSIAASIDNGNEIVFLEEQNNEIFFATYNASTSSGSTFSFAFGQNCCTLISQSDAPRAIAVNPVKRAEDQFIVAILQEDGKVIAYTRNGSEAELGRYPGWPLDFTYDLAIWPRSDGTDSIVIGHSNGLFEYRP